MADDNLTILSEYFHPESSATSQLLTRLATGLTDRFDVTNITAFPHYHAADREADVPNRETYQDIDIKRVRSSRFDKDELPKRVVNWLSYTLAATVTLLRTPTDVVLTVSNPPILPAAAWIRRRIHGTPYVYLVHDLYPDIAVELGMVTPGGLLERSCRRINGRFLCDATRIIVLGESMCDTILSRYPSVSESQLEVIHNWEDESFVGPKPKTENQFAEEHDTVEPFTLIYSGNIGRFHELKTVIDAVDRLDDQNRDVRFLIIGEGARKEELQTYVSDNDITAVEFLPFQPKERLPESLTCGDVSVIGIKDGMQGLCVSSKLYSSLATGQPILAVTGQGDEVAVVVENCECGYHVEPGDVDRCVEVIRRWLDDSQIRAEQGTNARECFETRFTFTEAKERYREVLEDARRTSP